MYALTRHFSIRRHVRLALALITGVGACAAMSACANPFAEAKIDPDSSVAPQVSQMVHGHRTYPTFASIPAMPKDLRRPHQYGSQAQVIEQARGDLEAKTAPETWSLGGTEGFAAKAQSEAGSDTYAKPTGDTDAFANTQRKRATPPPPPQQ